MSQRPRGTVNDMDITLTNNKIQRTKNKKRTKRPTAPSAIAVQPLKVTPMPPRPVAPVNGTKTILSNATGTILTYIDA